MKSEVDIKSIVAKARTKTGDGEDPSGFSVGNDVDFSKMTTKTPFDNNVIYNFDAQVSGCSFPFTFQKEVILDYIFSRLGIDTDTVTHPLIMTEPVCNPNYSRKGLFPHILLTAHKDSLKSCSSATGFLLCLMG